MSGERPGRGHWHPAVAGAQLLVLDFDGPLVRLLPDPEHLDLARRLTAWVSDRTGAPAPAANDHVTALKEIGRRYPLLVGDAEKLCTAAELAAADRRDAYPEAVATVLAWLAEGGSAVVVSNNAVVAVRRVLARTDLAGRVDVHGREPENWDRLKPKPDLLLDALATDGTPADRAVMVGDTTSDARAALAAGMPCVGIADSGGRATEFWGAGAIAVLTCLADLRTAP